MVNFRYDNNVAQFKRYRLQPPKSNQCKFTSWGIKLQSRNISGIANSLTVKDKSGLNIQSFNAEFFYGKKNAFVKKLY
jgi:hypothetical protein